MNKFRIWFARIAQAHLLYDILMSAYLAAISVRYSLVLGVIFGGFAILAIVAGFVAHCHHA